jgi:signal peptidase II
MFRNASILAFVVAVVDQASKYWLIEVMYNAGRTIEVTGFFNLVMVWNRGISFGMFQGGDTGRWLLALLATGVSIALIFWLRRIDRPLTGYGVGAVLGGAVGNLIDRISPRAAVADFFDFHVMGYHWPAFNIADMAITVGVGMILLDSFLDGGDRKTANSQTDRDDV